eukprot:830501_1
MLIFVFVYCMVSVNSQCSSYTCVPTSTPELNCGSEPELRYMCSNINSGECINAWTECGACCIAEILFNEYGVKYDYPGVQQVFEACLKGKCNTFGPTAQPSRPTSNPTATTLTPSSSPSATTDSPSITSNMPSVTPSVTPSVSPSVTTSTPSNMPSVTPSISPTTASPVTSPVASSSEGNGNEMISIVIPIVFIIIAFIVVY